jgi:Glycosyl transferase WecG/TagA/CpsF family
VASLPLRSAPGCRARSSRSSVRDDRATGDRRRLCWVQLPDIRGDLSDIKASRADLVVVALGQPRQELWLAARLPEMAATSASAFGAFVNFVSGRVVRAPRWMNRLGIEWLCRLMWNLAGSGGRTSSATPVFSGGHADSQVLTVASARHRRCQRCWRHLALTQRVDPESR